MNIILWVETLTKLKSHSFHNTIIREYDIRGVYDGTLFDKDAEILGNLFGLEVGKNKNVNVGYDGRLSSINLKERLIKGLVDSGVNVNEIGLVPTPLLYYSCFELDADGGIIVTGSHNPKEHNGFKLVLNNKPFFGESLMELSKKAEKFYFKKTNGSVKKLCLMDEYIKRLVKNFNQKKKINIIWDSGNGAAGEVMSALAKKIDGKYELLFSSIDGTFPNHHPDPSDHKNLVFCKNRLLDLKYDVGFAFDGDGDRLGVIDDKGRIISGDKLLLLLAKEMLKSQKCKVIGDVKCSQVLFDEVERLGGQIFMSKTGHSHVKNNLKKFNADLAGEMSGHIFFAKDYYGFDDAFFAAVKVLEILNNNDKKLSNLVDEIPRVFNTPEIRIDCDDNKKFDIMSKIIERQKRSKKKITNIDGVRVSEKDGWWLLRASNTQPAIVLRCESLTEDGLEFQKRLVKNELSEFNIDIFEEIIS
ncbi:MAG: phosphomannomutase [Rickettsiales bacterium]|nr:phosphomannomutase [Rickettsiales bacterium]RPG16312.1 MAG: phosphomannomutase/phosphoglucomutase [Pelagibacteraceae bacterium TMED195]